MNVRTWQGTISANAMQGESRKKNDFNVLNVLELFLINIYF